jgi:hypothetical protein
LQPGGRRFESDHLHGCGVMVFGLGLSSQWKSEFRYFAWLRSLRECGGRHAGGVRPGDRACGLCQCESGSGASLGVLPGGYGPQPCSSKSQGLTGTCVLREGGVAASDSSASVQGREMCVLSKRPAVWRGYWHPDIGCGWLLCMVG